MRTAIIGVILSAAGLAYWLAPEPAATAISLTARLVLAAGGFFAVIAVMADAEDGFTAAFRAFRRNEDAWADRIKDAIIDADWPREPPEPPDDEFPTGMTTRLPPAPGLWAARYRRMHNRE